MAQLDDSNSESREVAVELPTDWGCRQSEGLIGAGESFSRQPIHKAIGWRPQPWLLTMWTSLEGNLSVSTAKWLDLPEQVILKKKSKKVGKMPFFDLS